MDLSNLSKGGGGNADYLTPKDDQMMHNQLAKPIADIFINNRSNKYPNNNRVLKSNTTTAGATQSPNTAANKYQLRRYNQLVFNQVSRYYIMPDQTS